MISTIIIVTLFVVIYGLVVSKHVKRIEEDRLFNRMKEDLDSPYDKFIKSIRKTSLMSAKTKGTGL